MANSGDQMSVNEQRKEIERIKKAEVGTVLFQQPQSDDGSRFNALMKQSGVIYAKVVPMKGWIQYVKEA